MKKYYDVNVEMSANMGAVSFGLCIDEVTYRRYFRWNEWKEGLIHDEEMKPMRAALCYYMADVIINQHIQQLAADSGTTTLLHNIHDVQAAMPRRRNDAEENYAAYWIEKGLHDNNCDWIRKGLFRVLMGDFRSMKIQMSAATSEEWAAEESFEFHPDRCLEQLQQYGEQECYAVYLEINDGCFGDLEVGWESAVYMHPYLGEMLLADHKCNSDGQYHGEIYDGLMEALRWKAAEELVKTYEEDEMSLESFWARAFDEGYIDEDEHEEIMADICNPVYIPMICQIIADGNLLYIEDIYRPTQFTRNCDRVIYYED